MSNLGKLAAIATIVAAVFTVAAYFNSSGNSASGDGVPVVIDNPKIDIIEHSQEILAREQDKNSVSTIKDATYSKAEIKTRYKAALKIPNTITKSSSLRDLAEKSASLGYFKTAFDIALDIPNTITKSSALRYVSIKIAQSGNIEFAITVAEKIPNTITKSGTLNDISKI